MNGWAGTRDWGVIGGMLANDGSTPNCCAAYTIPSVIAPFAPTTSNYSVTAVIELVKRGPGTAAWPYSDLFGIVVRSSGGGSFELDYCDYNCAGIAIGAQGSPGDEGPLVQKPYSVDVGTWHTYTLSVRDNVLTAFVDHYQILTTQDNRFSAPGQIGLWDQQAQILVKTFMVTLE
jgi:hypothetical protein